MGLLDNQALHAVLVLDGCDPSARPHIEQILLGEQGLRVIPVVKVPRLSTLFVRLAGKVLILQ